MQSLMDMPPPIKGPAPRLDTLNEVEVIIRQATEAGETPISLAEITRRMGAKAVRHATVRTCVEHLKRMGCVWTTPDGCVEWANVPPSFWQDNVIRLR